MTIAHFSWPLRVYYEDTDAQGLVYYANYFRFMERARTEWLRSLGIEQSILLNEQRRTFVVAETQAKFHRPAAFDDMLVVTVDVMERARASLVLNQEIFRGTAGGELLCSGVVRVACINADTLKPAKLHPSFLEENAP